MNIAIVGAGRVGRALGQNLLALGHSICFVVRDSATATVPEGASTSMLDQPGTDAELYILAVPFEAVAEVVPRLQLRAEAILVDATNPFGRPLPGPVASGAAHVAEHAGPDVSVVKAFNVLGAEHMASPCLPDGCRPVLPVAGDDAAARGVVARLADEMGFDAVEVGGLHAAATMEEAARYWGLLAYAGGRGRDVVLVAHQRPSDPAAG
jgi:hypothetical protein